MDKTPSKANDYQVGGDHYSRNKNLTQQHWDYCWERGFDQFQYCITKYVERHKDKNGLDDLYKAKHHLEKYIEVMLEEVKKQEDAAIESDLRAYVNPDA